MTVAVFVASESDAACLIPWGIRFAQADHTELLIVCPRKSKGKRGWDPLERSERDDNSLFQAVFDILDDQDPQSVVLKQAISEGGESTSLDRVVIETREMVAPSPEEAFVESVSELDVRLLLLPAHEPVSGAKEHEMEWHQRLFTTAPCQVLVVKGSPPDGNGPIRVLIANDDGTSGDSVLALARGGQIAQLTKGELTLLHVRPDDDMVSPQIAQDELKLLGKSVSEFKFKIESRFELADDLCAGVNRQPLDDFDLIVVGTRKPKQIRALFRDLEDSGKPFSGSVIAIRGSVALSDRILRKASSWVRSKVPQIERKYRMSLVSRLQSNSEFNFDFVALISLSTLIAALGLARNSGAVVIGAMLVAPLMTPLVAIGFALVQGNVRLIREAFKSVVLGFTVALAIGAILGLAWRIIAPDYLPSPQMWDRGSPNLVDLVVALASGIAGAYAMGRPNLISALPGVAIAAALVPPIATSGLALSLGYMRLSAGASLLFFTNIVAIVLGTAITFWCIGISTRESKERPQTWPRYWFLGCVVVSFLLAAVMSYSYFHPQAKDKPVDSTPKHGSNTGAILDLDSK